KSAEMLPRAVGGYCIDPHGDAMVYGEKEKHTMDEVCTKEFDGECEVYKRFGVKRVVTLRYVDGSGQPNTVQVLLDQFADAGGASCRPKDARCIPGLGAAAVGYYKAGEKRYRMVVLMRDDADQARDVMKLLKGKPGALPIKDLADDAVAIVLQEAPDRAKAD